MKVRCIFLARLLILEGTRGTGKSTIAHRLRQNLEGSTLINFTGFKADGEVGYQQVSDYYDSWLLALSELDNRFTIICDRLFFSEQVYSKLYKHYDFTQKFHALYRQLLFQKHNINLYFLTVDGKDIDKRIKREKVSLFGNIIDATSVVENQQNGYSQLFKNLNDLKKVNFKEINTSLYSLDETYQILFDDYIGGSQ
jgi:deoxyguanosine kinase